jgi:hypothetical protein
MAAVAILCETAAVFLLICLIAHFEFITKLVGTVRVPNLPSPMQPFWRYGYVHSWMKWDWDLRKEGNLRHQIIARNNPIFVGFYLCKK